MASPRQQRKPPTGRTGASDGHVRALGYIRVSTQEQGQSGAGLEAQRKAIRAACKDRGFHLVNVVQDSGFSAKDLNRPALQTALGALDQGEVDALVVAKLDRLSRSLLDFASVMERSKRKGWSVVALDLGVDTTTPAGEMVANVMASFAAYERRLIGQRTKDALEVKKAQGVTLGRPRTLPSDVAERIATERAKGMSLAAIAAGLNADGVETAQGGSRWYPSTVRAVLAYAIR